MDTVKSFLSGMVRGFGAITIIPRHDRRPRILTEHEAMAKDFAAVGDSIWAAIRQYDATHGNGRQQ